MPELQTIGELQTLRTKPRPTSMRRSTSWRQIALILAVACGLASVKAMANPSIRRPVAQFIYFYQQTDDMHLWERVVYSWLLSEETTAPSS
jgi:hypothetical protein